jgi:probable F420-dependent oxidoreductase
MTTAGTTVQGHAARVGLALPQRGLTPDVDPAHLRRVIETAEQLGYDGLWTVEQVAGVRYDVAPLPMLAFAAALTNRVRLGTAVLVTPFHEPVTLAKTVASIDRLSGGRLVLGVGLGSRHVLAQQPSFGVASGTRAARLEESMSLLRRLWTGEPVTFEGRFWEVQETFISPTPVQQPSIPIWFGGHADAALRRAVRLGDGWIGASSTSTDDFRKHAAQVRAHLAEAGRDNGRFEIAKRVFVCVDRDRDAALRQLGPWFDVHGGGIQRARRLAVYGSADQCAAGLRDVISAGARTLVLAPVSNTLEQAERIAAEVLPRLG